MLAGTSAIPSALIQDAVRNALAVGHVPTVVNVHGFKALLDIRRDDPAAALLASDIQIRMAREHFADSEPGSKSERVAPFAAAAEEGESGGKNFRLGSLQAFEKPRAGGPRSKSGVTGFGPSPWIRNANPT